MFAAKKQPSSTALKANAGCHAPARHFQPLLDSTFSKILTAHYPQGVEFVINGQVLMPQNFEAPVTAPLEIRMLRKRKPSALGYLVRTDHPLPEDLQGLAISTFARELEARFAAIGLEVNCSKTEVIPTAGAATKG